MSNLEASAKGSLSGGAAATTAVNERAGGTASIAIAMFCVLLVSYVLMAADRYLFPVLAAGRSPRLRLLLQHAPASLRPSSP